MRQKTRWKETPEQWLAFVQDVSRRYLAGERTEPIARALRTSGRHVIAALADAGIDVSASAKARAVEGHRRWVAAQHAAVRDDVLAAYASEESTDVLAVRLGVGRSLIAKLWQEEGLATRRPWVEAHRGWHGDHAEERSQSVGRLVEVEVNILGGVWVALPMLEVNA